MLLRIILILGIVLGLLWQSVVGEWGLSFILLQAASKRLSDSSVLLIGFGLGLFIDLTAGHTLGSSSVILLTYIIAYWLIAKRYENHHFLLSFLTAISAVLLLHLQRTIEFGHLSLLSLWQTGVIFTVITAFCLLKEFTHRQQGIFLRK